MSRLIWFQTPTECKTDNSASEREEQFKYLGTTLTNQNSIREEIKSRLKSGNACYHSVQNLLSYSLLSKNVKIKIYRTIILPVVLYGCKAWSLTLKEECRLRVFENRVLKRIFGPKRGKVVREWKKLHNEELNDPYSVPHIIQVIKWRRMRLAGHVACVGEGEVLTGFWWGNLRERDLLEDPRIDGRIIIRWISQEVGWGGMEWIDLSQNRWWPL
jgi:hypothetical protein